MMYLDYHSTSSIHPKHMPENYPSAIPKSALFAAWPAEGRNLGRPSFLGRHRGEIQVCKYVLQPILPPENSKTGSYMNLYEKAISKGKIIHTPLDWGSNLKKSGRSLPPANSLRISELH